MSKVTRKIEGGMLIERQTTDLSSTYASLKLLGIKPTLGHQKGPVLLQERCGVFDQDRQRRHRTCHHMSELTLMVTGVILDARMSKLKPIEMEGISDSSNRLDLLPYRIE